MGEKFDGIAEWVGTSSNAIITEKDFHTIKVGVTEKMDILAQIKLFDLWDVPEYLVIVGKLSKGASHLQENGSH